MNGPQYKDYYKILGVPRTADDKEIKAAYRRLARKHHPDVHPGDTSAEDRFKEISEANDVLGNPEKRAKYDRFGDQWKQAGQAGFRQGQGQVEVDLGGPGGLNDLFESLFGGRRARQGRPPPRGEDVEFALDIALEDVFRGATKTQRIQVEDICSECGGMGTPRTSRGSYEVSAGACTGCRGVGRVGSIRSVEVKVPAGVMDGQRLRLTGQGGAGVEGKRGDMFLLIRVLPHPRFERNGANLQTEVDVPYWTAALGGQVQVKTLLGSGSASVPAGIQSGQKIRLAGQGMPQAGGKPAGDLLARVRITVPRDLSTRERELLAEIAELRK